MRREIITWTVVAAIIVAIFGGTVFVLNATLYSASGFVRSYLDSLARHDVDGALELAGTVAAGDASDELLVADALGDLSDITLISDDRDAQGIHRVVFGFTAGGESGQSTFSVRPQGTLLGLFPRWSFESSPLGVLQVVPQHGTSFTVNGVKVQASVPDQPAPYLVFAPGNYVLASKSLYLEAAPTDVTASQPGAAVIASVKLLPTKAFVAQVQKELNKYLDDCATQEVLLPTGCPFGEEIDNRIVSTPAWSIAHYPKVTLQPGSQPGSWLMPSTDAAAHLVVDIRSLFDGTVSTFDEDVPFTSSYVVTFLPDDKLLISGQ
ncbi:MAG: hypothetical protein JWR04_2899 [Rhodoglobus sp.]|jgi:hypothetical protein|nr:hypothetical protein [Rhodoglobus sp.]